MSNSIFGNYGGFDEKSLRDYSKSLNIDFSPTAKSDDNNHFFLTKSAFSDGLLPENSHYNKLV